MALSVADYIPIDTEATSAVLVCWRLRRLFDLLLVARIEEESIVVVTGGT